MDWRYLLDNFDGRIGRKTFWIAMGAVALAELVGHFIAERLEGDRLNAIVDLAFSYPEFAIAVKRAQDRDLPIWFVGAFFGAGVLLDLFTELGWAGRGDEPGMLAMIIAVPLTVIGVALLVELGFRKGTAGPNRHGPDPLARA